MDKVKTLEHILDLQLGWVRAADTRLTMIVPLATAMLTVLAALAPKASEWCILPAISCSLSAILILLAIVYSAFACFPRTEGSKGSFVFFGGIADREADQYRKSILGLEEEDYINDLSSQCHRNAQIARQKYAWAQKALASLLLAILPWLVSVYTLYSAGT